MSDTPTPPSSTEKTVTVNSSHLCRLWTFTYISLGLNVLILAILAVGLICHGKHHHKHHGFGDRGGNYCMMGARGGFGHGYYHGGMGMNRGWGGPGNFGGQGPMNMGQGPGMMGGNRGMGMMGGNPGMNGMMGGGFGKRGMMDGGKNGPPDPAAMTDMILNRLSAQLTLTDDEKAKIKPIILDQATQMQKDMEAQRAAREKAMEDTKAKIKALLTPDQQKQLDAIPLPGQKPAAAATSPAPAAK